MNDPRKGDKQVTGKRRMIAIIGRITDEKNHSQKTRISRGKKASKTQRGSERVDAWKLVGVSIFPGGEKN